MSKEIPLVSRYPELKKIPRIDLVDFPTPVEKLNNCARKLNVSSLWIKRDDLTNKQYGGNKPRKYEFMMAYAIKKKKKNILTIGGIGSNHALANTIYCKKLGLNSHIYLIPQPLLPMVRNNMLCDYYFGAHMHFCSNELSVFFKILGRLIIDRKAFLIMPGASVPRGTIGFVNAAFELADQVRNGEIPEPDHLFVAVGSGGTCAGLTLGLEMAGLKTKVHGIRVAMKYVTGKKAVLNLAMKTYKLLKKYDSSIPNITREQLDKRLLIYHEFYGEEYGRITEEGKEAVEFIKDDNIKLETTYTGKAFSALMWYCRNQNEKAMNETILFWNTYNSADLSEIYTKVDWHDLPKPFHKFFDGTVPIDDRMVNAHKVAKHHYIE